MAVSSRGPAQTHAVAATLVWLPRVFHKAPRCRGTAALWNVMSFQHAERWRPSRDGEMGLCDPC